MISQTEPSGLTQTAREVLEFAAHLEAVGHGGQVIFESDAERAYFEAAIQRIRLQRARRQPVRVEYSPASARPSGRPRVASPARPRASRRAPRPRGRRERRVARSTSSSDPGEPGESEPPGRAGPATTAALVA